MSETRAVVDVNEPDEVRFLLLSHPDVDAWLEHPLEAADIVVNGVGIERKTPSDFASSMTPDDDGYVRLDEQVDKLGDGYDRALILLEGEFDDFDDLTHTRLNPLSARGKAARITMTHGIPVVPTGGEPGTERAKRLLIDYAVRLGRKAVEEPSSDYLGATGLGTTEPPGKRMWACLEGVGPTRAGDLYDALRSPVAFVEEVPRGERLECLEGVDGIGPTTADAILEQLRPTAHVDEVAL